MVDTKGIEPMNALNRNSARMSEIESDARRFGASLPKGLTPGRSGTGWMVWGDNEHCIFLDFFGEFDPRERSRATAAALEVYCRLGMPHSIRVGFHQSEEVARRAMLNCLGFGNPEAAEADADDRGS